MEVVEALTWWQRLKGLIGTAAWPAGQALCIRPCNSVHTAFMRYPIDVVFVSRSGRVLKVRTLPPWRIAMSWRAWGVLELRAGEAARLGWGRHSVLPGHVWSR